MTVRPGTDAYLTAAAAQGILGGVKIDGRHVLIAVTEMQTRTDMDRLVAVAASLV